MCMKQFILILLLFLTGCVTHIPMPQPAPIPECNMKVNGECREQSASEKGGTVVRGHSEEAKDIKP